MKLKKICSIFLFFLLFELSAYSKEVLAPAIQFNINDYKEYFRKTTDYKVNLKSRSDYKITCDADIIGISWGDKDNIKVFDLKNEYDEIIDMKSTVIKLKYETYSYIRLYKSSREIVNIILGVNPMFDDDKNVGLGLCELKPYRE